MKDKEKQIWQDVANVMCECEDKENFTERYRTKCRGCNLLGVVRHIVFFLNNSDYRKLPEDSVVLSGLELADYKHYKEYTKSLAMIEKKTAEKFLALLTDNGERQTLFIEDNKGKVIDKAYIIPKSHLIQGAKQFGVEIKE